MLPVSLRDRELYRFFERSPIGMFRCDEPGRFHYVNPALVRMLGYDSAEELLEKNIARDVYAAVPTEGLHGVDPIEPPPMPAGIRLAYYDDHGDLVDDVAQ